MSDEQMFDFLYSRNRNPTLSTEAQANVISTLKFNIPLHGSELLHRKMTALLNQHTEEYRIYSMSKRFDNLALWASYGDNHRGYCLEFANEGPLFANAVEVQYGDIVPMDVSGGEPARSYFFYCKRKDWSNEQEVRLILPGGKGTGVKIDPRWLTRLILGKGISNGNEETIREWATSRQPPLEVLKAHFDPLDQRLKLS
jgi:hypothetical protein